LTTNVDKLKDGVNDLRKKGMDKLTDTIGEQNMKWLTMAGSIGVVSAAIAGVAIGAGVLSKKLMDLADENKKLRDEMGQGFGLFLIPSILPSTTNRY